MDTVINRLSEIDVYKRQLHACNAQYLACPAFQADISEYGAALLFKADILKTQLDGAGPIVGNPLYIKGYGSAYHELSQLVF